MECRSTFTKSLGILCQESLTKTDLVTYVNTSRIDDNDALIDNSINSITFKPNDEEALLSKETKNNLYVQIPKIKITKPSNQVSDPSFSTIKIMSLNINGLYKKTEDLENMISHIECDVLFIQETNQNDDFQYTGQKDLIETFDLLNYENRTIAKGGGIATYAKKNISHMIQNVSYINRLRWSQIKIIKIKDIYIINIYRSPSSEKNGEKNQEFAYTIDYIMTEVIKKDSTVIIMGDLNLHNDWYEDEMKLPGAKYNKETPIIEILYEYDFTQHIKEITREKSDYTLDLLSLIHI